MLRLLKVGLYSVNESAYNQGGVFWMGFFFGDIYMYIYLNIYSDFE